MLVTVGRFGFRNNWNGMDGDLYDPEHKNIEVHD